MAPEIKVNGAKRKRLERTIANLERKLSNLFNPAKRVEVEKELDRLQGELDALPNLVAPRFVADDITPEALAIRLDEHGERLGIFGDEGGVIEILGGRYGVCFRHGCPDADEHGVSRIWPLFDQAGSFVIASV